MKCTRIKSSDDEPAEIMAVVSRRHNGRCAIPGFAKKKKKSWFSSLGYIDRHSPLFHLPPYSSWVQYRLLTPARSTGTADARRRSPPVL